jgi:hypothetical protein
LSAQDALTAALLLLGLAALFAFTRSHWLDDWDSVNFAFGLDDFDVTKHWPHPPGYPVYIAAGKLVYGVIAEADCDQFRKNLASGRPVLSTNSKLCGIDGTELVEFKRDARIHDKHHIIPIFEYGKSASSPG